MANPGMWQSDKRLYVDRTHSRVVPGDSREAAFLLVSEGGEIPIKDAERLGLTGGMKATEQEPVSEPSPAPEPAPESEPEPEPEAETKAQAPGENKAEEPTENKAQMPQPQATRRTGAHR